MPAVIFDLDGVLIDSEGLQHKSYSRVLARFGVQVSPAEYAVHWIASGRGPEHAVEHYGLPLSPDELRELKHPVYHEILRAEVTLMEGAAEALERLHRCFPLALATNSNLRDVSFVMDHFDVRRHFDAIITREDYQRGKPAPDAFLTAATRLQTAPASCVVIEDAYKGVLAASRAGIPVIAVPNEWTRENDFSLATRVVESLHDVTVDLVQELVGQESAADSR